jgi:hypothetical protein
MATLTVIGETIRFEAAGDSLSMPLTQEVRSTWEEWQEVYRLGQKPGQSDFLSLTGFAIFDWLDQSGLASKWIELTGPRVLEVTGDKRITDDQALLLDLPWEILANRDGFLAGDPYKAFEVYRRIGPTSSPITPKNADLSLMFTASAPREVLPILDFEGEEAAVLKATEDLELSLFVEESGCHDELKKRSLRGENPDCYHFSCHGTHLSEEDVKRYPGTGAKAGPALVMETYEGNAAFVSPPALGQIWEGCTSPPKLVFLSACRTAETFDSRRDVFAQQLLQAVPNVIGWAGSVYDHDATQFARSFYRELAGFRTVTVAAALARRELLLQAGSNGNQSRGSGDHWHLARVWVGNGGGGALCNQEGTKRSLPRNAGFKAFLDKGREKSAVAGPLTFVGRRRLTQDALKSIKKNNYIGLALLGMGRHGKSSLAARIANRLSFPKEVVIYHNYDAAEVLSRLSDAVDPDKRQAFKEQWSEEIKKNAKTLALAIEQLLSTTFKDNPLLLIIDDFEQVLEPPTRDRDVSRLSSAHGWRDAMVSIFAAFKKNRGNSRLLLTSRYDFTAIDDNGNDLAHSFDKIWLPAFSAREKEAQWQAEVNVRLLSSEASEKRAAHIITRHPDYPKVKERILRIAGGNPGLQDMLARPLLSNELDATKSALDAVELYLKNPKNFQSDQNQVVEFFQRIALNSLKAALTPEQETFLRAISIVGDGVWPNAVSAIARAALDLYQSVRSTPVPSEVLDGIGTAAGVTDTMKSRKRGVGLGLIDVYAKSLSGGDSVLYLLTPLARPHFKPLDSAERSSLAQAAEPLLKEHWANNSDNWPKDERSVEAFRLVITAKLKP